MCSWYTLAAMDGLDGDSGAAPRAGWGAHRDQFKKVATASHGVQNWMLWLAAVVVVILFVLVIYYATKKDKFASASSTMMEGSNFYTGSNNSLAVGRQVSTQKDVESTGQWVPMTAGQTVNPWTQTVPQNSSIVPVPTIQPKLGSACAAATDMAVEEMANLEAMGSVRSCAGVF